MKIGYSIPLVLILISFIAVFSFFLQKLILSSLKIVEMEYLDQRVFATLESGEVYIVYNWITEPPSRVQLQMNNMDLTMTRLNYSNESGEALYRYFIKAGESRIDGFLKVRKDDL